MTLTARLLLEGRCRRVLSWLSLSATDGSVRLSVRAVIVIEGREAQWKRHLAGL